MSSTNEEIIEQQEEETTAVAATNDDEPSSHGVVSPDDDHKGDDGDNEEADVGEESGESMLPPPEDQPEEAEDAPDDDNNADEQAPMVDGEAATNDEEPEDTKESTQEADAEKNLDEDEEAAGEEEEINEETKEEDDDEIDDEVEEHDDEVDDDDSVSGKEKKNKAAPSASSLPPRPVKRARTAYFIFTDEKRPKVQAEHPGEGVAVVARIMGQMWSTLPPEEKESYQERAAQERDRVAKEMEEWKAAGGVVETDNGGDGPHKDSSSLIYPLGRIRKICKLDPEVRGMSKEALLLITKCAELATSKLGQETVRVAQLQNRRKLLPEDVALVCSNREQFLFLKDDVKDLVKDMVSKQDPKPVPKKGDTAREVAAAGSKPLTSYFGVAKK